MPSDAPTGGHARPRARRDTARIHGELELARAGDAHARERLFTRFMPVLRRWAHQQLPRGARDLSDTGDLVQATLMRALAHLDRFESRGEGAFLGYLRHILLNAARDEARRSSRRGDANPVDETLVDPGPSVMEQVLGRETLERYERGLARLGEDQRDAVILRLEMDYSHAEIAAALGRSSADAARMLVARALVALAETMRDDA
jgi:RNA polymerase sigma factor (sigma-70 family)